MSQSDIGDLSFGDTQYAKSANPSYVCQSLVSELGLTQI